MRKYSYGWEKLYQTMSSLITADDIRDRLCSGLADGVIHIKPEKDLPEEIQDDFKEFWERVTSAQPDGDEGTLKATLDTFSDEEANEVARQLLSFYDTVCRHIRE